MFYISLLLLLGVNFFIGQRIAFKSLLDFFIMHFLLLCAQIILIFEITSLLGILSQPWSFLLFQVFLLCAAIVYWFLTRRKEQAVPFSIGQSLRNLGNFLAKNKVFTLYAFLVFAGYVGFAILSTRYPQTTSDSLYNHLSRIGHWLQQGSLKPYPSTSEYGFTYPYNNSLLMMWSVLFLKEDLLVGLTQWFSAFLLAASIYGLALELKFGQKSSLYAALVFLTFPIVVLESGTAQNDLLAAAFFTAAVWLTISGIRSDDRARLVFAGLALALAVGTKQYVLYALPGLLLIGLYLLLNKKIPLRSRSVKTWVLSATVFTLLVGSYAYLQNFINFGNFFMKDETNILTPTRVIDLPAKFLYNTTRLTTQFVSCDGLPVPEQQKCLMMKETVFTKLFTVLHFDPRQKIFLLEPDCGELCYGYGIRYPFNEESSWFGPLSWLLFLIGSILTLIQAGKRKDGLPWLLLLAAFVYFAVTAVFKSGWDPYLGRYLILSTALVAPFSASCLSEDRFWQKLLTWILLLVSLVLLIFTILANDSRTLVTKDSMIELQSWGKDHSLLVTKLAYKLTPQFPDTRSYADLSMQDIEERIDNQMSVQMALVNKYIPEDGSLVIISPKELLLDYYLFGDHFTRKLFELTYDNNSDAIRQQIDNFGVDNVLIKTDLPANFLNGFVKTAEFKGWAIYQKPSRP